MPKKALDDVLLEATMKWARKREEINVCNMGAHVGTYVGKLMLDMPDEVRGAFNAGFKASQELIAFEENGGKVSC